jgi:hypothetical protein
MNRRKAGVLLSLLSLSLARPSFALERANLLFYLPFEGNIAPSIAGGKSGSVKTPIEFRTGTQQDIELVPGLRGTGLRAKPDLSFQYLTRESFSLREGTIAFWMKPVGWSGLGHGRNFISVNSDRVGLNFYIYPGQLYYYINGPGRYYLINTAEDGNQKDPFKDGQWTFLAGTFQPGEQSFYVNGDFMKSMTEGLLEPEFSSKGIIDIRAGDQVLDEIMVFDRALADAEITAIYKANAP